MAKTFKEIKDEFKQGMQETNAKFASDQQKNKDYVKTRSAELRETHQDNRQQLKEMKSEMVTNRETAKPKADFSNMTGTKFLMILWGTIATLPFLIIGLILFVIAGLFFWDAFIGL